MLNVTITVNIYFILLGIIYINKKNTYLISAYLSNYQLVPSEYLVHPKGFEPLTFRFVAEHSIQLS